MALVKTMVGIVILDYEFFVGKGTNCFATAIQALVERFSSL